MTSDLELNHKLALAIGWRKDQIRIREYAGGSRVECYRVEHGLHIWMPFDFKEWRIAGSIAERFDCFPWQDYRRTWTAPIRYKNGVVAGFAEEDTPQLAIALAVIQGAGK